MKKLLLALAAATVTSSAIAGGFASVTVENVKDDKTKAHSQAQYVRFGTDVAGYKVGVQARTQVWDQGGMVNSLETTVGKSLGLVTPFAGIGHDNGFNGAAKSGFQYGVVGLTAGAPVGPVYAFAGAKTRVNWQADTPKQTVAFVGASYPLTKTFAVEASVAKSRQDIKETAVGLGLRVNF